MAAYDAIADWYEDEFLPAEPTGLLQLEELLTGLLGPGTGRCLEIGCGTGARSAMIRALGWTPVGVDLSAAMLRRSAGRLPVARADAAALPLPDASVDAVASVLVHTDMPAYPAVLTEAARVLRPGGVFVHIGVHPCFCGGFADWTDRDAVVIRPGYRRPHRTRASYTDRGVRDKVGASHWPLADLLNAAVAAGLTPERHQEGGDPTPVVLGFRSRSTARPGPTG